MLLPTRETLQAVASKMDYPKGWGPLVNELIDKLCDLVSPESISIHDIKEKYGRLRFYHTISTYTPARQRDCQNLVDEYENRSASICQVCGSKGSRVEIGNTVYTLCIEHIKTVINSQILLSGNVSYRDIEEDSV